MFRFITWLAVSAAFLGACSTTTDGITLVVSSPGTIGVGQQRVLISVIDEKTSERRLVPENDVLAVFSLDGKEVGAAPAEWVWAIENVNGFYVTGFDFPKVGAWSTHLELQNRRVTTETPVPVVADVGVVEVGDLAPASRTPTYPASPFEVITTDPEPDPSFYSLSIADAVASGRPTVIVFATPAFCESAVCGPTLDIVKAASPEHPNANFIHVEVYENLQSPDALTLAPSVLEWGLPSEPWVFVTNASGVVTARFEGTVGGWELAEALASVGA